MLARTKYHPRRDVSLARSLSKLGYSSRSIAERLIRSGGVKVNGCIIKDPSYRCDLNFDRIKVEGKPLVKKKLVYIAMYKPTGVVTTRSDERGRKTVYDILGDVGRWVFPVGRLDKDTSGLLLLTNDNRLGERLTNPQSKVPKTYVAILDKQISGKHVQVMEAGMILDGERLMPAKIKVKGETTLEITIVEGKNRQIRRMCESLGYEVLELVRTGIGNLCLDDLRLGNWRYLHNRELELLLGKEKSKI